MARGGGELHPEVAADHPLNIAMALADEQHTGVRGAGATVACRRRAAVSDEGP